MTRYYKASLREYGHVVFNPRPVDVRPEMPVSEQFPASMMNDPIFKANVATCQACENYHVKSCGAPRCGLLGDSKPALLQAITFGRCPIEKLQKTGFSE